MIVLALEEFAPRRRTEQADLERRLHPIVRRALDGTVNTDGYRELIDAVRSEWAKAYSLLTEGKTSARNADKKFLDDVRATLAKTDRAASTHNTVDRIATWLATAILSQSTVAALGDEAGDEYLLVWTDMNDDRVRHTHAEADGQKRKPGEMFTVGGQEMPYPGYPGVDIELWINCRCTLRVEREQQAMVASREDCPHPAIQNDTPMPAVCHDCGQDFSYIAPYFREIMDQQFKDYTTEERKKAHTLPDGSFPIEDCADLKNAIQAIGRAKDPAKAKAHIRSRKKALGCPDVELPDTFGAGWGAPSETITDKPKKKRKPFADSESIPQADTNQDAEGYEGVTHAGLAVQASDTGRVLMIQRSLDQEDAPEVQGTWEFPGGRLEGSEGPEEAARREFCEEVGCPVPEGEITGGWRSEDGVYQGFVLTVDLERDAFQVLNPEVTETPNPDDPDRRKPDVAAWFSIEQIQELGCALRPECHNTDWSQFSDGGGDVWQSEDANQEDDMTDDERTELALLRKHVAAQARAAGRTIILSQEDDMPDTAPAQTTEKAALIPWHGVLTVEGKPTGDGRRFRVGSMRTRPLPLPLNWQKVSTAGHDNAVTVARIDREVRVPMEDGTTEIRAHGVVLATPEADEMVGLISEFGRFGVSVDADDASLSIDPETGEQEFTDARSAGSCVVAIPAFHEAWVSLGEIPEGFYDGGSDLELAHGQVDESLVAAVGVPARDMFTPEALADLAPGKTEDGPGWLTHPIPTDRLRDWWVKQGVQWGVPGDFNECRVKAAKYVKPQYLNGFCANRHYDALGTWPGRNAHAADTLALTDRTPAEPLTLVASRFELKANYDWFHMEEPDHVQPFTITDEGQVFGHIADWTTCHGNTGAYGECMIAPRSPSNYANFLLGYVVTDKGSVPTGTLTIGGGHADGRLSMRDAQRHYDDSTAAWADVNVVDGKYGIWACGWVRPGTTEEMVIAARASKLSGDWRRGPHGLDMIAALAVNSPGFAIPRIAANIKGNEVYSLVAAGMVNHEVSEEATLAVDVDALADAVALRLVEAEERRAALAALAVEFQIDTDAEMAKIAERVNI